VSKPLDTSEPLNPKDIVGQLKPPLHLIPSPALVEVARVMGNGAFKYGAYNWRQINVLHSTYVSAAERHLRAHFDGQDLDPGALIPHEGKAQPYQRIYNLAAAAASIMILLDAILTSSGTDDRPPKGVTGDLLYNSD